MWTYPPENGPEAVLPPRPPRNEHPPHRILGQGIEEVSRQLERLDQQLKQLATEIKALRSEVARKS
jgi:hypothetical protein